MLTSRALLAPTISTLLVDEHRRHRTGMLAALEAEAEALAAETPAAIVAVSARWTGEGPFLVGAAKRHRTLTDYSGFGVEVRYDCPGHPALARALVAAGRRAGLRVAETQRGVDSGITVPLHFLVRKRNVPVVPLSLADRSAAECRAWGAVLRGALEARPERIALVVGGMLSDNEHAWNLGRDVPEARDLDTRLLEALQAGSWSAVRPRDGAEAERARPAAGLRHLDLLRGFLGTDTPGTVLSYESLPGVGGALIAFPLAGAPHPG
jgi:aromatic ring-opening dioxygenase catalytic subunit (LigB family)